MIKQKNCGLCDSVTYEYAFGYKFIARLKRFLIVLLVIVALLFAGFAYFCANYVKISIMGMSMETTLDDGDCIILKMTNVVSRGDIVVIDVEDFNGGTSFSGKYIIKRVIALGGDEVYCENGTVYLKKSGESEFTPLKEDYASSKTPSFSVVKVGDGNFFFLGDNRAVSRDSTEVGCMSVGRIYGRVPSWSIALKGFTSFIYG